MHINFYSAFRITTGDRIATCLWLIALAHKHGKLSDSTEADLQAAAEEVGTDVDTLRNKVRIFIIFGCLSLYIYTASCTADKMLMLIPITRSHGSVRVV